MFVIIRIRSVIGARKEVGDTLKMLGMKRVNDMAVLPRSDSILGMIKKVEDYVTWGEISDEAAKEIKGRKLKPFKKKSIKKRYPKGDLGYRKDMEKLIKSMIS